MRRSIEQINVEEKEMTEYICARIPSGCRVVLAQGDEGVTWADLFASWDKSTGWHLVIEKSDEHVTLETIYDHFRRQEMSQREWRREREHEERQSKVFQFESAMAAIQQPSPNPPRILTAHDIVKYYQGKIGLRLAYKIMDRCKPVRAEGKRLVTAESFEDYLREIEDSPSQEPPVLLEAPKSTVIDTPTTSPKRRKPRSDDGFEFFRFPH